MSIEVPLSGPAAALLFILSSIAFTGIACLEIYGPEWIHYRPVLWLYVFFFGCMLVASFIYSVACANASIKRWYIDVREDAVKRVAEELRESEYGSINHHNKV